MKKKLTAFEAACIVAGNGIGGGLMALPFLAQYAGWPGTISVLTSAWLVTVILHFMVADMLFNTGNESGILSIFNEFLFRGKWQKILTAGFFLLLLVTLIFNLSAYITGGADIIAGLFGFPPLISNLIVYALCTIVPLLGLKALGLSEKATVLLMMLAMMILAALSFIKGTHQLGAMPQSPNSLLALYGLAMFSFSAFFSVPQAVEGLDRNLKAVKKAIVLGVGINLVMSLMICFSALYASETVTEAAIVGWSQALGLPVKIVGSLLILFAMLTSFWAISLALSDMVCEQLKTKRYKWFIFICSTLPCLMLSLFSGASFISFIGIAGGAVAAIIALLLLPAYHISCKDRISRKDINPIISLLGKAGDSMWLVVLIGLCYVLMAAGAIIAVF